MTFANRNGWIKIGLAVVYIGAHLMPYAIKKGGGKKPYKITKKTSGKVVGSSTSKAKASVRARHAACKK